MYEHRQQPLLSRAEFSKRVGRHGLVALGVLLFGLGIGVVGYHLIAHLGWIDSLLNASMILGGIGPVDPLSNNAGEDFRVMLRIILGAGVYRDRFSAARAVCAPHAASHSRGGAWIMKFLKHFPRTALMDESPNRLAVSCSV